MIFAGIRWFLFSLISFVLFLGISQEVSFIALISIVSASSLISMIPISISGLGLREGSFILLCSQIGIPLEASATVSILSLILSYSAVFVIFLIMLKTGFRKSVSFNV